MHCLNKHCDTSNSASLSINHILVITLFICYQTLTPYHKHCSVCAQVWRVVNTVTHMNTRESKSSVHCVILCNSCSSRVPFIRIVHCIMARSLLWKQQIKYSSLPFWASPLMPLLFVQIFLNFFCIQDARRFAMLHRVSVRYSLGPLQLCYVR
jgi:hypothetical protein